MGAARRARRGLWRDRGRAPRRRARGSTSSSPGRASRSSSQTLGVRLLLGDHVVSEHADAADLDLDDVARDHVTVGALGAHPEHVARMKRRGLAHLVKPRRGVPDLVAGREVFPDLAVVAHDDPKLRRIQIGDDVGAERLERIAIFRAEQRAIGLLPLALADVVADAVAEDAVERLFPGDVARLFAAPDCQLALRLDRARALAGHDDVLLGRDDRVHRAQLGLRAARVLRRLTAPPGHAFEVAAVVGAGRVEDAGLDRRKQLHPTEWMGGPGHRMLGEWATRDLPDQLVFDQAVADALPREEPAPFHAAYVDTSAARRSEEHTSELPSPK